MLEFLFYLRKHRVGTICRSTQKDYESQTLEIKNAGVFFFFQRSTLPLHWSDRGDNLSACKHTFSQSTFTLTPAHRYWIKPCSKGKTGRWINPVLLDLIHSYTEWCCISQSLGSLLGSLGVALHTEDSAIQWVTSIFIRLYGQRASAVLQDKHGKIITPYP